MVRLSDKIRSHLLKGTVIPAHPLALTRERKLDERRQRALTRYYIASGAGGIAVGVHTTQFEIRNPEFGLFKPVMEMTAEEISAAGLSRPFIRIAGIVGDTDQARNEAEIAVTNGYHLGLVSMSGLHDRKESELIKRIESIAEIIPVFGFYLQPAVGGRYLSYHFWKDLMEIPEVYAVKIAPFNRYFTLDVVRAVCSSSRCEEIALYTGNDDNIVMDLLTKYRFIINGDMREKEIVGGLLGHWAIWTRKAVEIFSMIREMKEAGKPVTDDLLSLANSITDVNAAVFDVSNNFRGCIPGIHEVLRRQGLLEGTWCLKSNEILSPGQMEEISRIYADYPELNDDDFVTQHLKDWLT